MSAEQMNPEIGGVYAAAKAWHEIQVADEACVFESRAELKHGPMIGHSRQVIKLPPVDRLVPVKRRGMRPMYGKQRTQVHFYLREGSDENLLLYVRPGQVRHVEQLDWNTLHRHPETFAAFKQAIACVSLVH